MQQRFHFTSRVSGTGQLTQSLHAKARRRRTGVLRGVGDIESLEHQDEYQATDKADAKVAAKAVSAPAASDAPESSPQTPQVLGQACCAKMTSVQPVGLFPDNTNQDQRECIPLTCSRSQVLFPSSCYFFKFRSSRSVSVRLSAVSRFRCSGRPIPLRRKQQKCFLTTWKAGCPDLNQILQATDLDVRQHVSKGAQCARSEHKIADVLLTSVTEHTVTEVCLKVLGWG